MDAGGVDVPVRELSGVTWLGGTTFAAASDRDGRLVFLDVALAPDGAITSATITGSVRLEGAADVEGVAFAGAAAGTVFVADESASTIREHAIASGRLVRVAPLPDFFAAHAPRNRGLESLGMATDGRELVTANEQALTVDGDRSTETTGTVVRLVRMTRERGESTTAEQLAYVTEPCHGVPFGRVGAGSSGGCGVVDVVVLPSGAWLVLERSLAYHATPLRTALFAVDRRGATDVSRPPFDCGLRGHAFVPVRKRLLWSGAIEGTGQNLEGLCVGPRLDDGGVALVGVVDDGDPLSQNLLVVFVVRGEVGTPSPCGGPCPSISITAEPAYQAGTTVELRVDGATPSARLLLLIDRTGGPTAVPGFGNVLVGEDPAIVQLAVRPLPGTDRRDAGTIAIRSPAAASLAGRVLYAQGFVEDASAGVALASGPIRLAFR